MVKIYRLVTKNTYEREMLDRAGLKLGLDKAVLQSMNTSQGGKDTQVSWAWTRTSNTSKK
jgi:chromodomain-helicase-DNA-binding protein 7